MSSFIVEPQHIAELVKHFQDLPHKPTWFYNNSEKEEIKFRGKLKQDEEISVLLGCANLKSYNARYPQYKLEDATEDKNWLEEIIELTRTPKNYNLSYAELINMCRCLNYQSCDYKFYEHTNASYILDTIKDAFVSQWASQETEEDNKISWSYPN